MKRVFFLMIFCFGFLSSFAQFVISAAGVHPENACDPNAVYYLAHGKAQPLEKIDSIESKLNSTVSIKQYRALSTSASVQFVVNCRNELGGGFHIVTSSGKDSIDTAIINFFKTVTRWKAGVHEGKPVDSWYMWKLSMKNNHIGIVK